MNTTFVAMRENGTRFLFEAKNFDDARTFCIEAGEYNLISIEDSERFEILDTNMNFLVMKF